jgi:hypothetical protein
MAVVATEHEGVEQQEGRSRRAPSEVREPEDQRLGYIMLRRYNCAIP